MSEEENILKLIIEKESWEEILYYIVSLEQLDPWDVNLVKLTRAFLRFIRQAEELDFRIPAKVIFVAAILLRLKSNYLSIFEEPTTTEEVVEHQKPFLDLGVDPSLVKLGVPMKRVPKRQVTLDELIGALKKALVVRERKTERRRRWRDRLRLELPAEEDITKRIENIMAEIERALQKHQTDKVGFRDIVEEWKREQIVEHFVPLLHLEQNQKVRTEQEDYFKEIFIFKQ